uniref:HTH_48 domain-containing protein n=1 Tax=Heterorhabditis bacteriophora TaxID=37862 RepID=A0A1I7WRQ2_HETBA
MGHAPKLSQHERGQIDAPSTRSREVILNFLRHQEKYGTKKSSGRPSDLNDREKRTILHTASNSTTSIVGIRRTCGTDASESTVWTKLNKCPNNVLASLSNKKMPPITSVEAPRPGWRTMT